MRVDQCLNASAFYTLTPLATCRDRRALSHHRSLLQKRSLQLFSKQVARPFQSTGSLPWQRERQARQAAAVHQLQGRTHRRLKVSAHWLRTHATMHTWKHWNVRLAPVTAIQIAP